MLKNILFIPLIFLLFLSIKNLDLSEPQENEYYITRRMPTREEVLVSAFKEEKPYIDQLWGVHESGMNPTAVNPTSGACGVAQSHPCGKMKCNLTHDIRDFACQVNWGKDYIEGRYGSVKAALEFWKARHPINGEDVGNWY